MEDKVLDVKLENEISEESEVKPLSSLEQDNGLKQVIAVIKEVIGIAKKLAIFLFIPVIITGLYGYYVGKKVKPTYTAKITFFLSEERPQIPGGVGATMLLQ